MSPQSPAVRRSCWRTYLAPGLFAALSTCFTPGPGLGVEGGYCSLTSVPQGGTIRFHISTRTLQYALSIYREGVQRVLMTRISNLTGGERSCPEPGYETGCGWPVSYTLTVPSNWPSGVYTGEFNTGSAGTGKKLCVFAVREDQPGSTSPVFVSLAVNTHNAYNAFGGKSLYGTAPSRKVSFNRPYDSVGDGSYYRREHPFVAWAEGAGYVLEYGTNVDLHQDASLLGHYSCFITLGHDEYWSREMRDHLDAFVNAGGDAMILSGNTCWWQVRYSPDLRTMICYKAFAMKEDPFATDSNSANDYLITTNWYKSPVNYPENSTTGLGWRHGGYHDYSGNFTYADGFGGYRVFRTNHWVFQGAGLTDGQMLGRDATIVGYEVDGTLLEARDAAGNLAWDSNRYYPLPGALPHVISAAETRTPANFVILGLAPATKGYAVMGYFEVAGGGRVFNAGTIDWVQGLATDTAVARITKNVLDAFSGSPPPPPPPGGEFILDNGAPGTTAAGGWSVSGGPNPYGTSSLYSNSATDTYSYRFNLSQGGPFDVFLWWTEYPSRLTAVPVDVAHGSGTARVTVNQKVNGGQWNRIGTWDFGTQATITVRSLGGGTTCADAVRLVSLDDGNQLPVAFIDSVLPNPATAGEQVNLRGHGIDPDGTVVDHRWRSSLDGEFSDQAILTKPDFSPGVHTIYFAVQDDQGAWSSEAQTALEIRSPNPVPTLVLDNGDPGTTPAGYWTISGGVGAQGVDSLYSREPGATYTYGFTLPQAGTYDVSLWWTQFSSRLTAVPVDIAHGSGTARVSVNQRINGSQWNSVGSWSFGTQATITIHSLGGGSTCADAVRLTRVGP